MRTLLPDFLALNKVLPLWQVKTMLVQLTPGPAEIRVLSDPPPKKLKFPLNAGYLIFCY